MEEEIKKKVGRPIKPDKLDKKIYNKIYYLTNRDKYIGTKECPICGSEYSKSNFNKHLNGNFHKKNLILIKK